MRKLNIFKETFFSQIKFALTRLCSTALKNATVNGSNVI